MYYLIYLPILILSREAVYRPTPRLIVEPDNSSANLTPYVRAGRYPAGFT